MIPKAVYDTNIIVSAALSPHGIPSTLVALALERRVRLFCSPAILKEYAEVLPRPKFRLRPATVQTFIRDLTDAASIVHPTRRLTLLPDEADNKFLECAQKARAGYLVTGNKRHFPFTEFKGTKIVSPAEFVKVIGE